MWVDHWLCVTCVLSVTLWLFYCVQWPELGICEERRLMTKFHCVWLFTLIFYYREAYSTCDWNDDQCRLRAFEKLLMLVFIHIHLHGRVVVFQLKCEVQWLGWWKAHSCVKRGDSNVFSDLTQALCVEGDRGAQCLPVFIEEMVTIYSDMVCVFCLFTDYCVLWWKHDRRYTIVVMSELPLILLTFSGKLEILMRVFWCIGVTIDIEMW